MVVNVGVVAAGGAIGSTLRYALSAALRGLPGELPVATLVTNVSGAFALGFLALVLLHWIPHIRPVHLLLCAGVMGSFTTFSTLALEVTQLADDGSPVLAMGYPLLSVLLGLAAALAGMSVARWCLPDPVSEAAAEEPVAQEQRQ